MPTPSLPNWSASENAKLLKGKKCEYIQRASQLCKNCYWETKVATIWKQPGFFSNESLLLVEYKTISLNYKCKTNYVKKSLQKKKISSKCAVYISENVFLIIVTLIHFQNAQLQHKYFIPFCLHFRYTMQRMPT